MLNEKKELECDIRDERLLSVIKNMSTSLFAPKNASKSKSKKKPPPKPKVDTESKKKKKHDSTEEEVVEMIIPMSTRNASKQIKESDLPIFSRLKEKEDLFRLISVKEKSMLEKMKQINAKSKRFAKAIRLWNQGFSKLYLFWIDLTLSISEDNEKLKQSNFDTFYNDKDDNAFLLLVGQRQSDLLYKMEVRPIILCKIEDEEEDEYMDVPEEKPAEYVPHMWKKYLSLCRGKGTNKWKDNYMFLSIKVFISLFRNNPLIDEESYMILGSAFDLALQNKARIVSISDAGNKMRDE